MNITFNKMPDGKYEIRMNGRLDECTIVIEALENSVADNVYVRDATSFLRKKLNEHRRE
jgi:hypothetical protein